MIKLSSLQVLGLYLFICFMPMLPVIWRKLREKKQEWNKLKKKEQGTNLWHENNNKNYRETFMHTYKGDSKPSKLEISSATRLRNFEEIFTGKPGPERCDCGKKLKLIPVSLSISFSGRVLHTMGSYCKKCDEEPGPMHVIVTVDDSLAMIS